MPPSPWDQRIARALLLAGEHSTVAGILTFYAALATCQKSLRQSQAVVATGIPSPIGSFLDALDVEAALSAIPPFLSWLQHEPSAPPPLRQDARELGGVDRSTWRHVVFSFLAPADRLVDNLSHSNPQPPAPNPPLSDLRSPIPAPRSPIPDPQSFVIEAVLQPFAEAISLSRSEEEHVVPSAGTPRCPVCASRPTLGVLREEGHGAKRGLLCGLCLTEWNYLRVVCPACSEQRFDELPVYTAEQFPHVRIDACESCRIYLKTIDLTKDGLAVPIVDDLASVALDIWAREQGYRRLHPNLLRTG